MLEEAEQELATVEVARNEERSRAWLDIADARFALYYWLDDLDRMKPLIQRMRPREVTLGTLEQRMRFFSSLAMLLGFAKIGSCRRMRP